MADLLNEVMVEDVRGRRLTRRLRLRNVVGSAERQRLEADLRVAAGQGRGHDDDEVALLCQQLRQRGDAVEFRHFDIEHGDIRVDAFDLVDGVEARAQGGGNLHVRLRADPPRNHAADHDGVINHHHAQLFMARRGRGRSTSQRNTHYFTRTPRGTIDKTKPEAVRPPDRNPRDQISPTSWNFAVTISLSNGFMMYSLAPACSARAMCATSFSVVQNTTLGMSPPGMRRRLPRNS